MKTAEHGSQARVSQLSLDEALSEPVVGSLASGAVLAVRVPGFVRPKDCRLIAERLVRDHRLSRYQTSDGAASIKKFGMPLFEAAGRDSRRLEHYYSNAVPTIRALRELCHPSAYPMDRLRLHLQELWPAGARFEVLHEGRRMFVGMPRVFEASAGALPHVDRLAWDVPGAAPAESLVAQFAANVHLATADRGGEVELWQAAPGRDEYERLRLPASYGLDRAKLSPCDAVVAPQVGDLILFNSNRIHAVRACEGGPRVTVSCFVGYRGVREPLTFWS